mmetsp:Transcript_31237/g.73281  ORF Transcript_31237/g.73281 Transcript_31237/m.73281 type:complete len:235 (-) Transcript_31237:367-1071(-)
MLQLVDGRPVTVGHVGLGRGEDEGPQHGLVEELLQKRVHVARCPQVAQPLAVVGVLVVLLLLVAVAPLQRRVGLVEGPQQSVLDEGEVGGGAVGERRDEVVGGLTRQGRVADGEHQLLAVAHVGEEQRVHAPRDEPRAHRFLGRRHGGDGAQHVERPDKQTVCALVHGRGPPFNDSDEPVRVDDRRRLRPRGRAVAVGVDVQVGEQAEVGHAVGELAGEGVRVGAEEHPQHERT